MWLAGGVCLIGFVPFDYIAMDKYIAIYLMQGVYLLWLVDIDIPSAIMMIVFDQN